MKLYKVFVECEFYFAAEEPIKDDCKLARMLAKEVEAGEMAITNWNAREVKKVADLPPSWHDELPICENGRWSDKDCLEILWDAMDQHDLEAMQKPMPNQQELPL